MYKIDPNEKPQLVSIDNFHIDSYLSLIKYHFGLINELIETFSFKEAKER